LSNFWRRLRDFEYQACLALVASRVYRFLNECSAAAHRDRDWQERDHDDEGIYSDSISPLESLQKTGFVNTRPGEHAQPHRDHTQIDAADSVQVARLLITNCSCDFERWAIE
jgi:hypothetical protein